MIKNVPFVAEEYIERNMGASTDFIQGWRSVGYRRFLRTVVLALT
jgi:hypothetical protein